MFKPSMGFRIEQERTRTLGVMRKEGGGGVKRWAATRGLCCLFPRLDVRAEHGCELNCPAHENVGCCTHKPQGV